MRWTILSRTILGGAVLGLLLAPRVSWAQAKLDTQLLLNGDAEAGDASPGGSPVVAIPNWDTMGTNFSVEAYGTGDETLAEGVRIKGGKGFFVGGPSNAMSEAVQDVDVSALAADIDTGKVNAVLSAQMSGCGGQGDNGTITASFLDAGKADLGSPVVIGPQPGVENNVFVYHVKGGAVPKGTRTVEVHIVAVRAAGSFNDSYIDNISLVLTKNAPPATQNGTKPPVPDLVVNGDAEAGMASATGNDVEPIPGWTVTGPFTVVKYGAVDAPGTDASTTNGGGNNLFAGGPGNADSSATQTADVSARAADIDARKLALHFTVALGSSGMGMNTSNAYAEELDASGNVLLKLDANTSIGANGGLDKRTREAPIVPGTRKIRFTLHSTRGEGTYNGGYFDNVSASIVPYGPLPAPIPSQAGAIAAKYDTNLLVDPGAEDAMTDPTTDSKVIPIPGWTLTGNFSGLDYMVSGDIDSTESDHVNGGHAYFVGGVASQFGTAAQTVDVSNFAADIDAGAVTADAEADMAGYQDQGDNGTIYVTFLDAKLKPLAEPLMIGPVHGSDPVTSVYSHYKTGGAVPAGTRNIQVMLVGDRTNGSLDDAYFDNIVLSLMKGTPKALTGDLNGDGVVDLKDATLALELSVGLLPSATQAQKSAGDANHDGKNDLKDATLILEAAVGLVKLM